MRNGCSTIAGCRGGPGCASRAGRSCGCVDTACRPICDPAGAAGLLGLWLFNEDARRSHGSPPWTRPGGVQSLEGGLLGRPGQEACLAVGAAGGSSLNWGSPFLSAAPSCTARWLWPCCRARQGTPGRCPGAGRARVHRAVRCSGWAAAVQAALLPLLQEACGPSHTPTLRGPWRAPAAPPARRVRPWHPAAPPPNSLVQLGQLAGSARCAAACVHGDAWGSGGSGAAHSAHHGGGKKGSGTACRGKALRVPWGHRGSNTRPQDVGFQTCVWHEFD